MITKFHPLAELFPLMEGAEFDALAADIKENGLREPIVILDDQILDGRNRHRACAAANVEPIYQDWDNSGDPRKFVISKNLHRRHLSESQRAMAAARLVTTKAGDNSKAIESARAVDAMCVTTRAEAAEMLNISESSVSNARTVLEKGTPEEVKAIEAGVASPRTVADQIRAKMPAATRAKQRAEPMSQAGKNPERIQRQQINGEIWTRVKDAILHLTNLPLPSDVVSIVRAHDKTGLVDARGAQALQWLKDFSDAWRDRNQNAA